MQDEFHSGFIILPQQGKERDGDRERWGGHTLRELAEVTSLKLFKDINTSKEKILGITSPPPSPKPKFHRVTMAGIRHGNTIGNLIRATFPALYKGKPWKSHQQARPYGTDSFAFRQERIGEDRGVSDKYVSASKEAWRNGLFGIHSCNFWGGSRLNKNKFLRNQEFHRVSSITVNTSDQNHF